MPLKALTTNLMELNRLYGLYYDAVLQDNYAESEVCWRTYVEYCRRYREERHLT